MCIACAYCMWISIHLHYITKKGWLINIISWSIRNKPKKYGWYRYIRVATTSTGLWNLNFSTITTRYSKTPTPIPFAAAPRSRGPRRGRCSHVCPAERRRRRLLGLERLRGAGDGRYGGQTHTDGGDGAYGGCRNVLIHVMTRWNYTQA